MEKEMEISESTELPAVIKALLDVLDDKDENVRQMVNESIERISAKRPEVVIHTAVYFWELHKKISVEHMTSLLTVMCNTCKNKAMSLDVHLASSVAELAVCELMGNAKNEAAELLVVLSRVHCTQAMGGLLTKLEPGILPHHMVVSTMGSIAAANPDGMLSFFKIVLTIILPMLTQTRDDTLKEAFCYTIGKFFEAINDHIEEGSKPEISKDTYTEEICSAYDILMLNWLKQSRDNKVAEAVLTAIAPIVPLLPKEMESDRFVKLIPTLLSFSKRSGTRLAATRVLAVLLSCATLNDKEVLRPFLEQIHQALSELVTVSPFDASRDVVLTHYEALQCSRSLVILYPEEGLDRILQQLKSPLGTYRSRALIVLRHLINTLPPEDDTALQRIALTLQHSLGEIGVHQMTGAIVALTAHPSLQLLPSQRAVFVSYMVDHSVAKSVEAEACSEALYLLATTVSGTESWLWPCLINSLLYQTCTESAVSVLRALLPLASKIIRSGNSAISKNFSESESIKVLSRCLELLGEAETRLAVINFLKSAAPLFGNQLKPYWDEKLVELVHFLQDEQSTSRSVHKQRLLNWEEKIVELLEESVKIEGESWGSKLADQLETKASVPCVTPLLAAICNSNAHIKLLIELARTNGICEEYTRAVGICSKRHLSVVLKLIEKECTAQDMKKIPARLLGFVKDTKAVATAEAAKVGLLRSYAEIAQRGESEEMYSSLENHAVQWIIRQLNDCKELSVKEAGLIALEQVANAVHPNRLHESAGLSLKASGLACLLGILQSSSGYKPLQLYPPVLRAAVSLIRIPPTLCSEERDTFLSTVLDKIIGASTEIVTLLQPDVMQQIMDELGILCNEIVSDSADALAELVDILLPWMQSKTNAERKTTLLVFRSTLSSYYNSIKYTFPGGKLVPGKLVGRTLSWCADSELELRLLVVDCVGLALNIAARHRSLVMDSGLEEELKNSKTLMIDNPKDACNGIKELAAAASNRIPDGELISLAEGLIEGLLYRGEAGLAAGLALAQFFQIRGKDLTRTDMYLVDNIIVLMRQMENVSCRKSAAGAVSSLMSHQTEEVIQCLLLQPLPFDRGCEECWKAFGASAKLGPRALKSLLVRLENNKLFNENVTASQGGPRNTAYLPSLAAIMALKHLLQTENTEVLIQKQLAELLSVLLKYLAGWLYVDAPVSVINTKFGYVPNREACKINPQAEVYFVLSNVLTIVDENIASNLLRETVFDSELHAEEFVVSTIRTTMRTISNRQDVLSSMAQSLGKLITSSIPVQRAVAATFYSELIGKVNCGAIWLDAIINTLHEAKTDFSPLVRKLATIGLARIAYLEPKQTNEYFESCMEALINGLEEPATREGGNEVILESLRGLTVLLSVENDRRISPRVVLALKPFIEKENWVMRLAAISALGAVASGWHKSVTLPDDDITDHLLGCLPSLVIRLEDTNLTVVQTTQETLRKTAGLLQCKPLSEIMSANLGQQIVFNLESFLRNLIDCLLNELPQRANELRNAVTRGYSKSENSKTRATAALILGLFGPPRPEDVQRLLQLLHDTETTVRIRAAHALSLCFSN